MKSYLSLKWPAKLIAQAVFVVATGLFIAVTPVSAQSQEPLSVQLKARKVLVAEGKETFESAEKAKPGDTIEYATVCKNTTARVLGNLKPNLPIPAGMEYEANTAKPVPTEASLDGKKFEKFPIKRKFKTADGKEEEREVAASEIRALRWNVGDLAGGASTTMVARVRVSAGK